MFWSRFIPMRIHKWKLVTAKWKTNEWMIERERVCERDTHTERNDKNFKHTRYENEWNEASQQQQEHLRAMLSFSTSKMYICVCVISKSMHYTSESFFFVFVRSFVCCIQFSFFSHSYSLFHLFTISSLFAHTSSVCR